MLLFFYDTRILATLKIAWLLWRFLTCTLVSYAPLSHLHFKLDQTIFLSKMLIEQWRFVTSHLTTRFSEVVRDHKEKVRKTTKMLR